MSDSISELARKYREEMMRMYSTRKPSVPPPPPKPPEPPRPPQPPEPPRPPQPPQPPRPSQPPQPPRPPQPPEPPRPPQPPEPPRPSQPPEPPRPSQPPQPPRPPQPPQPPQPPRPQPRDVIPVNAEPVPEAEPELPEPVEEAPSEPEIPEPVEELPEEDYADPVLPEYIQPVTPSLPSEWQAQEEYDQRNTAEGRLYIVAAAADNAYPVPGATVTIYTRIGDKIELNYILTTDESGRTPTVTLPAPPAVLSQNPDNHEPYAMCNIHIYASGYFQEEARNVPIFAGVTSRQEFQMIPLPLAVPEDIETIVFSESGGV